MSLPLSLLVPDRTVHLRIDGEQLSGRVIAAAGGWLRLSGADGEIAVNLAQVAWIRVEAAAAGEAERPVPAAKEVGSRAGGRVPGRPWSDEQVRAVIDGFLDDRQDGALAEQHGRTRHQITVLRQAWECARGNLPEDRLSPAAQLWVGRIRTALRD